MKRIYFTIFCLGIFFGNAMAKNPTKPLKSATKKTNIATTDSTEEVKPLKFNGYVDSYYFGNFNGVQSNLGASGYERAFDQKANVFQVGLAQIKTTYSTNKVEGVIDLTFGNHGDLGNYGNVVSPVVGATGTALAIKQAYLTWKASSKFSLTAGQFGTHIGYEVIDAPINYNYSLSNLFTNGPFYHTGVKATITASDKFAIMAGLVNGLDSKDDNNKSKGFIGQIFMKPTSTWSVYLNYFGSNESATATKSVYNIFDLTTSAQVTEKFALGLNAAYGSQDEKTWGGVALYSNVAVSEKFGLGARYEYFDNASGIRALLNAKKEGTSVNSFTLTGNVKVSDNLLFKPEFRIDAYKEGSDQFTDKDGKTKDSQSTFGGALVFYF